MKTNICFLFVCLFLSLSGPGQIVIEDVSPTFDNATIDLSPKVQSASGKALCIAISSDGMRVYLGGHSGVWRSDDGGLTWNHLVRPQPAPNQTHVSGALLVPTVYDLLVSPSNKNIVLAATGRDARVPDQSGIYRSVNGGTSWSLVHQFTSPQNPGIIGRVGRLAVAPDNPQLMYAAGRFAVGISTDGGQSWSDVSPRSSSTEWVWHVVAGPEQGSIRRVYAVGTHVWYSSDGGMSWAEDPSNLSLPFPTDAAGVSSRALSIHPANPAIIYLNNGGKIWRGDFSSFATNGKAAWKSLSPPLIGYPGTTASGGDYIVPHIAPDGNFYLIVSDRRTVHISIGEPDSTDSWIRFDEGNPHVDPHGIALTADFQLPPFGGQMSSNGRIYMVNDGGANVSVDGGQNWIRGKGLSTLGLVNAAVLPNPGGKPGLCIGMGDNSGYYSRDGGDHWRTQDYLGGDNDCCFADLFQSSRLIVFAPRSGPSTNRRRIFLYEDPQGGIPNAAFGTNLRQEIPGPPPLPGESNAAWNAVSNFFLKGYRPLILTLSGQSPRPDGDFVTIRFQKNKAVVLRTTKMSQISSSSDWITSATNEASGAKVFQQGPDLPASVIDVVQASGGHENPVFYVSDPGSQQRLWKWKAGMQNWRLIVGSGASGDPPKPAIAQRFFVDPYRSDRLYVLGQDHVWRSENGGTSWIIDVELENALTENGAFPFNVGYDGNPFQELLKDMIFDPNDPNFRFAISHAGVFYTRDGVNWDHLLLTSAMPSRPSNAVYDPVSDPCIRALYVATNNRGLLKITGIPPDMPYPVGSVLSAQGKVSLLRVHDVGTGYGPPDDQLNAETIIWLDSYPGKAFGFQLRDNSQGEARSGMLDLLRDSFNLNQNIRIDYVRNGCNTGRIIRVMR